MKAMILAAGRGERLRPLTDTIPKPLLEVKGEALIVRQIKKLKAAGIKEIVINLAWLGEQIYEFLGNGQTLGVKLEYSKEPPGALEAAGGIIEALPLLDDKPFIVVNSDIWTDYDYAKLKLKDNFIAHLVLVKNPPHNSHGDFGLDEDILLMPNKRLPSYTFSGIGIYHPELFKPYARGSRPLLQVLTSAIDKQQVTGILYQGTWIDIGTKKRLQAANNLDSW